MSKQIQVIALLAISLALAYVWFSSGRTPAVESTRVEEPKPRREAFVIPLNEADASPDEIKNADLEREALRGNREARSKLCSRWIGVAGVTADYQRALVWCELAGQSGDVEAQLTLARLYQLGRGVPADAQTAIGWYEKAVLKDSEQAMYLLGRMLAASESTADQARGTALLQRAAARGHRNAQWELEKLGATEQPQPQRDQSLLAPRP